MYYTYMIRCEDNSIYTGITTDIDRRFSEHTSKNSRCAKYTLNHQAVKLEAVWESESRALASKLEYHIKRLNKNNKEDLIRTKSLESLLSSKIDVKYYSEFKSEGVYMKNYEIISLVDRPELKTEMATWFNKKWGIPYEAYEESMNEALEKKAPYPQWYVAVENNIIIGGLGVIKNDFHDRVDLFPNVCAVYVEESHRGNGIAGKLLNYVCLDMKKKGVDTLYLVTDHTGFYERYGWEFHCMAQGDGEEDLTRLYIHNQK